MLAPPAADDSAMNPMDLARQQWIKHLKQVDKYPCGRLTLSGAETHIVKRRTELEQLAGIDVADLHTHFGHLRTVLAVPESVDGQPAPLTFKTGVLQQLLQEQTVALHSWATKDNLALSTDDLVQAVGDRVAEVTAALQAKPLEAMAECMQTSRERHQAEVDVNDLVTEFNGLLLNPDVTQAQIVDLQGRIPADPAAGTGGQPPAGAAGDGDDADDEASSGSDQPQPTHQAPPPGIGSSMMAVLLSHTDAVIPLTLIMFGIMAFLSASFDMLSDAVYIQALSTQEQQHYIGVRTFFYQVARVFCIGGVVMLVGFLPKRIVIMPHGRWVLWCWPWYLSY